MKLQCRKQLAVLYNQASLTQWACFALSLTRSDKLTAHNVTTTNFQISIFLNQLESNDSASYFAWNPHHISRQALMQSETLIRDLCKGQFIQMKNWASSLCHFSQFPPTGLEWADKVCRRCYYTRNCSTLFSYLATYPRNWCISVCLK
jgi:hypothetical protein